MDASHHPASPPPLRSSTRAGAGWQAAAPRTVEADTAAPAATADVVLRTSRVISVLMACVAVLLVLHLVVVWSFLGEWRFPAREKFYLDAENNLPTVFSMLILLTAAGLFAWIAAIKHQQRAPLRLHWLGLAVIFFMLTVDESASLHELLIRPLRDGFQLTGWLRFPWVLAGGLFVLCFAIAYLRFLAHLPSATRWTFIAAGVLYVGGALGMEMVGGQVFMEEGEPGRTLVPYMVAMTLEELFEMTGIVLLIYGLLRYLRQSGVALRIEVR
ncbi:hypothetical protein WG922_08890 [Ramlibacter sp. AN1015]|uniref:hypothetical protein n=1 Tax=Ramlibacter sp. AN1015 TaxID=3133428 RepID=UPI0030BC3707